MDKMKSASADPGRYSIEGSQEVGAGQSEGVRKEAVEPTPSMRGEAGSRNSKTVKEWVIQFVQRILSKEKTLGERTVTVENKPFVQSLKKYSYGKLEKIGSGIVLVCGRIATVFRSRYENERRLARAISDFRENPDALKTLIRYGIPLNRKDVFEDYCPPLVRAMIDLRKYDRDQLDSFKGLLDVLVEGGANVREVRRYPYPKSPLGMALFPFGEHMCQHSMLTNTEVNKLKGVIKYLVEKGFPLCYLDGTEKIKEALIKYGCVDIIRLMMNNGILFRSYAYSLCIQIWKY